jgi:hypothetical protein
MEAVARATSNIKSINSQSFFSHSCAGIKEPTSSIEQRKKDRGFAGDIFT